MVAILSKGKMSLFIVTWCRHMVTWCRHMVKNLVNIGSGNGLLSDGTKPFTDVDFSSQVVCGIHLRTISQEVLMNFIHVFQNCTFQITTIYPRGQWVNTLRPRQMDAISQTTYSSAFSWMKMFEFRLKFHWSLFPRIQLTIFQQWFR